MNHSSEVFIHGRVVKVRYISVRLVEGIPDILTLEEEENKAVKDGFQPFGKPVYMKDWGMMIQKMVRRI